MLVVLIHDMIIDFRVLEDIICK